MLEKLKIGDICNITTGKLDSNQFVLGGEYPFYTCAPEPLTIDSYAFDDSVILIAGNNAAGNFHVNRFNGKFNAYQRTYILTEKPNFDLDYIFYSLKLELKRLKEKAQGSQTKFLTMPILNDISIPKLDLKSQQKIATVLSSLDSKIELNNKINAELEAMAKTLYDYWFVHNDKVCNWEIVKLGTFITVNERSITKDYSQNEIEYIDIASVSVGRLESTQKYELTNAPSRARRLVKHGDTIWSTVRPNRKSYLFISNPKENLVVSTGFAVLTPKTIPPSFLYFLSTTDKFVNFLVSNAEGSSYPAVSADRFAEIEFPMPPEKELTEFEKIVSPMLAKITQNEIENQTLSELRDWLLPMLMNGQVTVS